MSKRGIVIAVVIVLAAAGLTWWEASRQARLRSMPYWTGEYPDWAPEGIEEPPISEQIEAQIEAIKAGEDIQMPIPLYIAGERIDNVDFELLSQKLRSLGYVEKTLRKESDFSIAAYAHPDYRELLYLSYLKKDSDTGVGSLSVFSKSSKDFSDVAVLEFGAEVAGEGTGSSFGRLHLGIPLSKANEELKNVPYRGFDWRATDILKNLLKMNSSTWTSLFQGTIREPFAVRSLQRGNYTYSLEFTRGKLKEIMVVRVYLGTSDAWVKTSSDAELRRYITSTFHEEK